MHHLKILDWATVFCCPTQQTTNIVLIFSSMQWCKIKCDENDEESGKSKSNKSTRNNKRIHQIEAMRKLKAPTAINELKKIKFK